MLRIRFEKTGSGIWISHLDLMRVFQRAFRRAGLSLRPTQGYSPHAFVSLALPLSVGTESVCELLECELTDETVDLGALPARLNAVLPAGIVCREAYEGTRRLKELTHLRVRVDLKYDRGVSEGAAAQLEALFARETLVVEKNSKNGPVQQDIRPLIRALTVRAADGHTLCLEAVICAQNPSLNPDLLSKAIRTHLPAYAPDFAKSTRLALLDASLEAFR